MRNKILDYFRNAHGEYVSGQQISDDLKVSRTAIWKHIKVLKERGYVFESSTRKGYRLLHAPNLLTELEINSVLSTESFGRNIIYRETAPSTNAIAKEEARRGAPEGTIVVAEEQTGGRGRLQRAWFSPYAKGIWFSLILRPHFSPLEASKCTLLAAVALVRAFHQAGLTEAGIKWPNDLLVKRRKIVGILTEMDATMEEINYIVMGMGINTDVARVDLPEDLRDKATSFLLEGVRIPRKELLNLILMELETLYAEVETNGFATILDEWRKYSVTLGRDINVITPGYTYSGKAVDIDSDGCLLVETDHGVERVLAGEVSIRYKDEPAL